MGDARKAYKAGKGAPTWIPPPVWEQLLNFWATDDSFKKLSSSGKKNRSSDNSGFGPSLHVGGSRSFGDHARKMAAEKGEEVTPSELYLATHQKKGEFVCPKAQNIYVSTINL
ncbi:hypothetical protein Dimus_038465 [Dionaea muscipula]